MIWYDLSLEFILEGEVCLDSGFFSGSFQAPHTSHHWETKLTGEFEIRGYLLSGKGTAPRASRPMLPSFHHLHLTPKGTHELWAFCLAGWLVSIETFPPKAWCQYQNKQKDPHKQVFLNMTRVKILWVERKGISHLIWGCLVQHVFTTPLLPSSGKPVVLFFCFVFFLSVNFLWTKKKIRGRQRSDLLEKFCLFIFALILENHSVYYKDTHTSEK